MALRVGSGSYQFATTKTIDLSSINANSISVETVAVTGVVPDTRYVIDAQSLEAGLFLLGAQCTTAGTLIISCWNSTNSSVDPASQTFRIIGL